MLKSFYSRNFIFFGTYVPAQGLLSELQRHYQFNRLAEYREGLEKQYSGYERTGGNDDGFSGKYSFIRLEGAKQVIAVMKCPGVINRIWTPAPSNDTIS